MIVLLYTIYMTFSDDDLELKSFEYIAVDCIVFVFLGCDLQLLCDHDFESSSIK